MERVDGNRLDGILGGGGLLHDAHAVHHRVGLHAVEGGLERVGSMDVHARHQAVRAHVEGLQGARPAADGGPGFQARRCRLPELVTEHAAPADDEEAPHAAQPAASGPMSLQYWPVTNGRS
jgi:hypothetical protein